jgi:putative flavoprotein involved in K+ transport
MNKSLENEFETIIIGAGQAGLSVGRYLKEKGRSFLILEKNSDIGQSWAERYDSLILDSYAIYSELEGFPFMGEPLTQPTKKEVVEYLQDFATHFHLEPQFFTAVHRIEKEGEKFVVRTSKGIYYSKFLVLATGPFSVPNIPAYASKFPESIFQMHSSDYRNPAQLKGGSTLVVGRGNSGVEIVEELAEAGDKVYFSFRGKLKSVKSTHLSQWLAYGLGLAHIPNDTMLGKMIMWYTKGKAVGMDIGKFFKNKTVIPVGEFVKVEGSDLVFSQATLKDVKNVIWATGYGSDFSLISIPEFKPELQKRGVTNIPGLLILNMRWQYSKSSSHLAGISRDAKYIAEYIIKQ